MSDFDQTRLYADIADRDDTIEQQRQRLRNLETDINLLKGMLIEEGYGSRYLDEITTPKEQQQ